jgi:Uma2 family endonuclease
LAKKDRVLKLPLYARYGVAHAWLVDPGERTLEAFTLRESAWVLIAVLQDEDVVQLPPFDAVGFALSDLWA